MDMMYRVKNMEAFKDGNVLGGRFLKAGEILIVSEMDMNKIRQSGGIVEVIESVIPNPKKMAVLEAQPEEKVEKKEPVISTYSVETTPAAEGKTLVKKEKGKSKKK